MTGRDRQATHHRGGDLKGVDWLGQQLEACGVGQLTQLDACEAGQLAASLVLSGAVYILSLLKESGRGLPKGNPMLKTKNG